MSIASEHNARGSVGRHQPTFAELYSPKLLTVLREGYGLADLRADALAGLTVAIVALPLSMAIAIASGVSPGRGLYTAVVGGFLISLLGGSRFQIGGPAGAFIVLVAATVDRQGLDGLLVATMMSGVMLVIAGYLRLGTYIKFIPYPVTVGFTAGIAVIIFASQLKDLFGITLPGKEPGELIPKLVALAHGAPTANIPAVALAVMSIVIIVWLKQLRPTWPGILIAVVIAAIITFALQLPVETIGTRFGGICVTGTIARTATNVRAGARGPVSGMLHSLFLLVFMLIAAPLASYIPLTALAAVLVVVAWNMAEKHEFLTLIRSSWGDATVLLATFGLTIFRDLTEGILVGFALGAVLFINRMAQMTGVEDGTPLVAQDRADFEDGARVPYDAKLSADKDVLVYRITGAFFFGAASTVGTVLDSIADRRKAFVVDFAAVPFLDSTAANAMSRVAAKAKRQGIRLFITGASPTVRRALLTHGVRPPLVRYRETIERAVADIKGRETAGEEIADGLAAS